MTQAYPACVCHLLVLSSWLSAMLCRFRLSETTAGVVAEESQWNENEPSALRPAGRWEWCQAYCSILVIPSWLHFMWLFLDLMLIEDCS